MTLRDNIIGGNNAPGTCNELLKVNRADATAFPRDITIQGNVFSEPANAPGADMIDAVRPGEIDVVDNIFFSAPERDRSQSFITLKRQAPAPAPAPAPEDTRQPRYRIARNVFLNWGGRADQAFIQFGEDGIAEYEITDALVENNLLIGNSPARMAAPIQLKGVRGVTVRANTVVGDLPSGAFGLRVGTEGDNPTVGDIHIHANIWSDPTGTMGPRFVNAYGDVDTASIDLARNLFWNAGRLLPAEGAVPPARDVTAIDADPLLPVWDAEAMLPLWDATAGAFASGSQSIRAEFLRLVAAYGALGAGSPAIDAADPALMPAEDIRGLPRDAAPDLGAYEARPGEEAATVTVTATPDPRLGPTPRPNAPIVAAMCYLPWALAHRIPTASTRAP